MLQTGLQHNTGGIHLSVQAFPSSASPLCFMLADRSAEPGRRAAAAAAAVKRWAAVLSDHSYPSSKSCLQANHMELSRPTARSTSGTREPRMRTCAHTYTRHRTAQQHDGGCCDSGFTWLMGGAEIWIYLEGSSTPFGRASPCPDCLETDLKLVMALMSADPLLALNQPAVPAPTPSPIPTGRVKGHRPSFLSL